MKGVINSLDALNAYNTLLGRGYAFNNIVEYILKSAYKTGYDRSDDLCIVYFKRYAIVLTPTQATRLKRV